MAPPLTFSLSVFQAKSLVTAQAWAANASFASIRSRSSTVHPAFSKAARDAGIGPVPIIAGSTPRVAQETIRAIGTTPRASAADARIKTSAAAPSLIPDALPAVTVPSLAKAGRSFASVSTEVPCFGCSSSDTITSPLRPLIVTGTISSVKRPAFCAASALFCEAAANWSCSSRLSCHFSATFSAVLPM